MPTVHIAQNNFTSGQLDPTLHERYEYQGYANGLVELSNMLILPQGGVTKRPGSRYVATCKDDTAHRLIPFIISNELAYVLEMGIEYIRFYRNGEKIAATEIVTPYGADELHTIHRSNYGHTMIFTHAQHPPYELIHISDTSWVFRPILFGPPPSYEVGWLPPSSATLSAPTGNGVTVTTTTGVFYPSDVDRLLVNEPTIGSGKAVITTFISSTQVTIDVTTEFPSVNLLDTQWRLLGSPVATLTMDKFEPVGAKVTLSTRLSKPGGSNLVIDGDFPDLANWSDFSGRSVLAGTGDGFDDESLTDADVNFILSGVRVGYRALDLTNGNEDSVLAVAAQVLTTSKDGADWAGVIDYDIKKTGVAYVPFPGKVYLDGGVQGIAHIEQSITTVIDTAYSISFDISDAPLSMMVGSSTDLSDMLTEFTYQPGNAVTASFVATSTTSVIAFRNNQNNVAGLSNVSITVYTTDGFRATDVGKFIRANSGIIEITEYNSSSGVKGVIRKGLDDNLNALSGAWAIESSQWTPALGYPNTLTFQGGRLNFGGSPTFPNRLWGSRVGVYSDFGAGIAADDAFQFDLAATEVNEIRWMSGEQSLIVGTNRNEFVVQGDLGTTITPTGVQVTSPTGYGSATIQPARTPQAILFVPRSKRRLYESVSAASSDSLGTSRTVEDRSILAENLTKVGIHEVAYQQEPRPIVWVVTEDGKLSALTYLKEHVIAGWGSQPLTGTARSVCVIPHPDGDRDQVWLLVVRTGATPYVEYLDDASGHYDALQLDCATTSTFGTPSSSLGNLGHLEGLEVAILVDGAQQMNQTVFGGQVTLDPPGLQGEAGLPFSPTVETLRPTYQNIPLSGLHLSSVRISATFLNSLNAVLNGERLNFGEASTPMDTVQPLFSGPKEIDVLGWDVDAHVRIVQDQPYPITVLGITRYLEIEQVGGQSGG